MKKNSFQRVIQIKFKLDYIAGPQQIVKQQDCKVNKNVQMNFLILTNGVVSSGVVVGSILLAGDELLRVEELAVSSSPHLINDSWLKIHENSP